MPARPKTPPKARETLISKSVLAKAITQILEDRDLTQTDAAAIVEDAPSQISLIASGKLDGFSAERLIRILSKLGRDVDIRIKPASGKTGKVRVVLK